MSIPMTQAIDKLQQTRISDGALIHAQQKQIDRLQAELKRRDEIAAELSKKFDFIVRHLDEIRVECYRTADGLEKYRNGVSRWLTLAELLKEADGWPESCYASERLGVFLAACATFSGYPVTDRCEECGGREMTDDERIRRRYTGDTCPAVDNACRGHHEPTEDCDDCDEEAAMDHADRQRDGAL
jgi:hypothetical protein